LDLASQPPADSGREELTGSVADIAPACLDVVRRLVKQGFLLPA